MGALSETISLHQCNALKNIIRWANITCTVIDTAIEIRNVILGGGTVIDVIAALLKGVVVGFMVDGMCKLGLGVILKPMMAIFGLVNQVDQIQEAIKEKNVGMIALRFTQLICMLFGLTSQCFTRDTLVATETGLRPIEEIKAGDYVWSENTETGEKALKQVLSVSVTETTVLVHVETEDGTEINTTENHPFYVEEKGWCAVADLEAGEHLHTQDGKTEIVLKTETEQLKEPVKVYNMEIEDWHTYYVSDREVLVHNEYGVAKDGNEIPTDLYSFGNKSSPRGARAMKDFGVESFDSLVGPEGGSLPQGASNFSSIDDAPLTGHYHILPAGTQLPSGLDIIADGVDVMPNSQRGVGHYTIFPTREMTVTAFNELYKSLPWQYGGRK